MRSKVGRLTWIWENEIPSVATLRFEDGRKLAQIIYSKKPELIFYDQHERLVKSEKMLDGISKTVAELKGISRVRYHLKEHMRIAAQEFRKREIRYKSFQRRYSQ